MKFYFIHEIDRSSVIFQSEFKTKIEELDDSNVDDDLDKILQNIKVDQQDLMDAPDSPVKIEPKTIIE